MAQSITLKIAGKEYPLIAASPDQERLMRRAAEDINKMLARYDAKFMDRPLIDKLAFVTLNQTMYKYAAQQQLQALNEDIGALNTEIENYLKNV